MSDTRGRVAAILVAHLGCAAETVVDDAPIEKLGADSLDNVELVMTYEEEFLIEISDDEGDKLFGGTVADTVELIENKRFPEDALDDRLDRLQKTGVSPGSRADTFRAVEVAAVKAAMIHVPPERRSTPHSYKVEGRNFID